MAVEPRLIIQVPSGGRVEQQFDATPPAAVVSGEVVVIAGATDAHGNLEATDAGEVVLSVPSPETLRREPDEVRRVIRQAGVGAEPVVVVVEAAEELREDELAAVLEAAEHTERAVILRVIRDA
jgi:hypothetical protein